MTRPRPTLGDKVLGAFFSAVGEHALDASPELRALAGACGYTSDVAPSRAIQSMERAVGAATDAAEGALEDAVEAGINGLAYRLRAKARARGEEKRRRRRPEPERATPEAKATKDGVGEKLREVFDGLSPMERTVVEQMLREKGAAPEILDLLKEKGETIEAEKKADGSYGPKESR